MSLPERSTHSAGRRFRSTVTSTRAYWVIERGRGDLLDVHIPDVSPAGHSLVQTSHSAVSPGTERLVGTGGVPESAHERMRCSAMAGDFTYPLKYGYSLVGAVTDGALVGQRVFVMHPHQEVALIEDAAAIALPAEIPSARATLFPNLETALNGVWDAEMDVTERSAVVGGGIVGLLVAFAAHEEGAASVTVAESDPARREFASALPWVAEAVAPEDLDRSAFDVAWHTTGRGQGLQTALDCLRFEGRVVDLSWYGKRPVTVDLGASFHWDRKRIVASQVTHVAPRARGSGRGARTARVLELLRQPTLDRLLAGPVPFEAMPAMMQDVYAGAGPYPLPVVTYA